MVIAKISGPALLGAPRGGRSGRLFVASAVGRRTAAPPLDPVNCTVRPLRFWPAAQINPILPRRRGKTASAQTVNGFFAKPADAAAMSSALPIPVDLDHLARYTGGDPAVDREILTLFVQQSSAMLAQ